MGLFFFRLFLIAAAIWTGAAVHEAIVSHLAWYRDAVSWVRYSTAQDGALDPWSYLSIALGALTIASWAFFAFRRRGGLLTIAALTGVTLVLIATYAYFVPTLGKLANPDVMSEADIVAVSRLWIELNLARLGLMLVFIYLGMVATQRWTPGGI